MPVCKVCGKEIPKGQSYKGERYKNEKFCSEKCYKIRLKNAPGTKKRRITDYIRDWAEIEPDWIYVTKQIEDIMKNYDLDYDDIYLVIKYVREYEGLLYDDSYGLYPYFPKYIEPTRQFIEDINNAKAQAKTMPIPTPIHAKKYRPKRKFKFDLTFD